jgi:hypothetical protein
MKLKIKLFNPTWWPLEYQFILFYYRSHSPAFGKVVMGIQTTNSSQHAFKQCLDELDFKMLVVILTSSPT